MKKIFLFLILVSFSYSQATLWKIVGSKVYLANKFWTLSLREGMGTGMQLGYVTSGDSGSIRYYNGSLQFYDGGAWRTVGYSGDPNSFTKPQIDTVGTVVSGVWNATPIITTYGGTGLTSYTQGDIPYYNSGTTLSKLALGSSNQMLGVSNAAPAPEYKTLNVATTGTDFNISYSGSNVYFNLPTASATNRGAYSTTDYARTPFKDESNTFATGTTQTIPRAAVDTITEINTGSGIRLYTSPNLLDTMLSLQMNGNPFIIAQHGNGGYDLFGTQSETSIQNTTTVFNDSLNGFWRGRRARGTISSPAAVQADDILTSIGGLGFHTGGKFAEHSQGAFVVYAYAQPTETSRPTYLTLETTPVDDTVKATAVLIYPDKQTKFFSNILFHNTSAEIASAQHNGSITIRGDSVSSTAGAWGVYYGGTHATQAGNRLENANTFSIRNLAGSTTNLIIGTLNGRRWAGLAPTIGGTSTGSFSFGDTLLKGATVVMDNSLNLLNIGTIASGTVTTTGNYLGSASTLRIAKTTDAGVIEISGGTSPTSVAAWISLRSSAVSLPGQILINSNKINFRNILGTNTHAFIDTVLFSLTIPIASTDKITAEDSMRVGTSTPAKINNNGSFTGLNLSQFDSTKTNKIIFSGVAPPIQSYSLGADSTNRRLLYTSYQVQRSVDLTHGVITSDILDSNSVMETVLDSIQMAANFPSVGKIVKITLLGNFTLTGSGTCIIRLRHRNGASSDTTGTVLDSLILTNIATDKGLALISTTTFRSVGASGSVVSFMRAETGTTVVTGGNILGTTTINTTASNTFYITSKRSVTSDKVKIRQGWAETKN